MSTDDTAPLAAASDRSDALAPGTCIGRYVVLRSLGHGGHGEVVAAFDPVLDRNVALKLLRDEGGDVEALIREARVLARTSHPNIVTIHDAGIVEGRAFLTMELVAGSDLAAWSRHEPRPDLSQRLATLRQIGEGLASAHALGIVHGDVKPANVLVGSGRARVTDFGLSVWIERERASAPEVLRPHRWYGTPAYMAPEQYEGNVPQAASDQYAFCQMAWELLYDAPAFVARTTAVETASWISTAVEASPTSVAGLLALAETKRAGPPALPHGRGVPRAIGEALRRGLAPDPGARWPAMTALLAALEFDLGARQRRRRVLLGGGLLAVAASVATAGSLGRTAIACERAGVGMAETWNDARKVAIDQALARGQGLPDAGRAWVLTALGEHADRWVAARVDACRATHERGEQSAELLDLRMACLDQLRHELGSATAVLEQPDRAIGRNAMRVLASLTPVSQCADATVLRADAPPRDPALASAVAELEREIDRVRVLGSAGRYEQALAAAVVNVERATEIEHPPTRAKASYGHATLLYELGRYEESVRVQEQAVALALAHGPDRVAIDGASDLAFTLATELQRLDVAAAYMLVAEQLARRNHAGPEVEAGILINASAVAAARGEDARDRELLERAAVLLEAEPEANAEQLAAVYQNLAASFMMHGDAATARRHAERAHAVEMAALGPDHPRTALTLVRVGEVALASSAFTQAEEVLRTAIAALERTLGPDHGDVLNARRSLAAVFRDTHRDALALELLEQILARIPHEGSEHRLLRGTVLADLGATLVRVGRSREGEPMIREALAEHEASLGPEHAELVPVISNLGAALLDQGRLEEARVQFERALEVWKTTMGEDASWLATEYLGLAEIEVQSGRPAAALPRLERAVELIEHDHGTAHPQLVRPLAQLAHVLVELGAIDRAEAVVQRASSIASHPEALVSDRGDLAFAEAELRSVRGDRAVARARAEAAVALYREAGDPCCKRDREAAETWLREHAEARGRPVRAPGRP